MTATPQDVVGFWLTAGPKKWFAKTPAFDSAIALRFEATHLKASRGGYDAWSATAQGALGLLILLDQFPRNLYRDSAHAFATDGMALAVAKRAVEAGLDAEIEPELRRFVYMPLMHSEALADQDMSLALFTELRDETGDEDSLRFALMHRDIIVRFGRFPHRNAVLGRETTPDEQTFLENGGFAG